MSAQLDRKRAALLGLALGDTFGAPVQGWSVSEVRSFFGGYAALPSAWPAEARGLAVERRKRMGPMGLHSAATQQALALVNISAGPAGWCGRRWADWLIEGFVADAWRGSDLHFMGAVHRLRKGRDHRGAGALFPSAASAARAAPLGALYTDNETQLCDVVYESTLVTHGTIRAAAAAHAVATATADLVRGVEPAEIRRTLAVRVSDGEARWRPQAAWAFERGGFGRVPEAIEALFSTPLGGPETVRASVKALAEAVWTEADGPLGINGDHAALAALHGLAMALRDDVSPDECLAQVVSLGGASSAAGAICGALLGARFGAGWLAPSRLLDGARIEGYADALAGAVALESREAFMGAEAEWTRRRGVFIEGMVAERRTGRPRPVEAPS